MGDAIWVFVLRVLGIGLSLSRFGLIYQIYVCSRICLSIGFDVQANELYSIIHSFLNPRLKHLLV